MFENIGCKIKEFAKFLFIIALIAWIVCTIAMFVLYDSAGDYFLILGICSLILGPISAVLSSYLIYGFGELVENSAKEGSKEDGDYSTDKDENNAPVQQVQSYQCPKCKEIIPYGIPSCPVCQQVFNWNKTS